METKRVAIYLRVSTTDQSTELQRRELEEYAKNRKDFVSLEFYEDHGISGTSANRPGLKRLMKDVEHRKIDVILIWKLDRLFRSLKDLVNTLQSFTECNVALISFKENIDLTSSSGRLLIHLLGAFAEFEAALIKERVKAGIMNARAKGTILGRPKIRDDVNIKRLREEGLSVREISKQLFTSIGAVQRSLK